LWIQPIYDKRILRSKKSKECWGRSKVSKKSKEPKADWGRSKVSKGYKGIDKGSKADWGELKVSKESDVSKGSSGKNGDNGIW